MKTSLLRALAIVERMDTSPARVAVYEDLKSRSLLISFVESFHKIVKNTPIGTMMICVYALRPYFDFAPHKSLSKKILVATEYENEDKQLFFLQNALAEDRIFFLRNTRLIAGGIALVKAILASPGATKKTWRVITHLSKRHDFMPLCRISRTLGYYLRFEQILSETPPLASVAASNYCPLSAALFNASKAKGIPTIYISHAAIPSSEYFPVLDTDLAILEGPTSLEMYSQRGPVTSTVVFKGALGESRELSLEPLLSSAPLRIGFFLTALLQPEELRRYVEKAVDLFKPKTVLIRPHPVPGINPNLADVFKDISCVSISQDSTLTEDLDTCDLILAGNSSVHVEVLRSGTPSAYLKDLDSLSFDFCGFVSGEIIPHIESIETGSLNRIHSFFSDPNWISKFRRFDWSYRKDPKEIFSEMKCAIDNVIESSPSHIPSPVAAGS